MNEQSPLLEYDPSPEATLEPSRLIAREDVPERCVLCFFQEVIDGLRESGEIRRITALRSEMGEHPVYELNADGRRLAVYHPGVGAPLAAGGLEELIAKGCGKFIACGGAGVLDREIACGHLIVPVAAVRDEGTSYHYLPPSREVRSHPAAVAAIEATLKARNCEYLLTKTWTTDGFYRETRARIQRRKLEGCLTVEMEAAAFFAVAQFRGVVLGQILYGGDDCSGEWDHRDWNAQATVREALFRLATEACLKL
jgi:uridine phosphorylase